MKITRQNTNPDFTPVTLSITIENEEELKALWGRMNLAPETINIANARAGCVWSNSYFSCNDLWKVLDSIAASAGLRQ